MIIGSKAILYHFPDFPRKPKDVDIIKNMYIEEHMSDLRVEWLENTVLQNWFTKPIEVCTPNELYTLKISHCFWDLENGSWNKHIWDIQWLKEKGCKFIPELFYQLYNYWETIHGKNKRSNLNMSAEKFFDNVVNYPVEHDYLHELLVKHEYFGGNEPTYKKILKDGEDVDVSEEKFNKLTEKEKFNLVIEEIMVMALERYSDMFYKKAFGRMLKKFILSHCPIWEGIWIIQNHKELMINIPFDYFTHLKTQIMNYKLINEALENISSLRYNHKKFKKVSDNKIDNLRGEGRQGEYDELIEIYSLGEDDLHLKLVLRTDSYGDNECVHSIQIVKPIIKQVTDFEPIK